MIRTLTGVLLFLTVTTAAGSSHACTVCHSKNPKMVRMHEALGFKDCFRCHAPGSMRSGDGNRVQLMKTDERCIPCHGNNGASANSPKE